MSFVLKWIQGAARLLKEAHEYADQDQHVLGAQWHADAEKLLKPQEPRGGIGD